MDLKEYQIAAGRTVAELGSEKLNLSHMLLGMVGEENELWDAIRKRDVVNISEELTDIMWFLANFCSLNDFQFDEFDGMEGKAYETVETYYRNLCYNISKLVDIEKKFIAYNKPQLRIVVLKHTLEVFYTIKNLYTLFHIDMYKSLENNINKLKIRYPEKFTDELATNRNLEMEREELEK